MQIPNAPKIFRRMLLRILWKSLLHSHLQLFYNSLKHSNANYVWSRWNPFLVNFFHRLGILLTLKNILIMSIIIIWLYLLEQKIYFLRTFDYFYFIGSSRSSSFAEAWNNYSNAINAPISLSQAKRNKYQ